MEQSIQSDPQTLDFEMKPWRNEAIAPNGRSVALNFDDWFGQSVMVSPWLLPQVMYHATYAKFDEPTVLHGDQEHCRFGFHVGSFESASARLELKRMEDLKELGAQSLSGKAHASPVVMPLYVRACKPLRLTENRMGRWGVDDIMGAVMQQAQMGDLPAVTPEQLDDYFDDQLQLLGEDGEPKRWSDHFEWAPGERSHALRAFLEDMGYDAIVYQNEFEGGGDSVLVMRPEQLKHADVNSGVYAKDSPSLSDTALLTAPSAKRNGLRP